MFLKILKIYWLLFEVLYYFKKVHTNCLVIYLFIVSLIFDLFWPMPFRRVKTIDHTDSVSSEEVFVDSESDWQTSVVEPSPTSARHESPRKQFVRTNVPSNEMIASLNLKDGQNLVTFSFSSRVLGTQQVWYSLRI